MMTTAVRHLAVHAKRRVDRCVLVIMGMIVSDIGVRLFTLSYGFFDNTEI